MLYLALILAAVLIGFSKAGFGGGLGMLTTPMLAMVSGQPNFAIAVALPLLLTGDVFCGKEFFGRWNKRVVLSMLPGVLLGVVIGSILLNRLQGHEDTFNRVLGVVAIVFGSLQLWIERRRDRGLAATDTKPAPPAVGLLAGTLTAIVSTLAHQGGLVSNLYLGSQRLTKEEFVATSTALYFTLNALKVAPYVQQALINRHTLVYSLALMPVVWVGGIFGARLVRRIDPRVFTRVILGLVLFTGVYLLLEPFLRHA